MGCFNTPKNMCPSPPKTLYLGILVLSLAPLSACQLRPDELTVEGQPQPKTNLSPTLPTLPPKPQIPQKITPVSITATVDAPTDVKVKQGDFVRKGQVITDQEITRLNLEQQKKALLSRLKAISSATQPELSTKADEELIAIATKQVETAKTAIATYHRESPWTDFARENLPLAQEDAQEIRLQDNLKIATQNLNNAQQKLKNTQTQLQAYQSQKSEAILQVQAQIQKIDAQLPGLQPIKSPQNGTIIGIQAPTSSLKGQPVQIKITLLPGDQPLAPVKPGSGSGTLGAEGPASTGKIPLANPALPSSSAPPPFSVPNSSVPNSSSQRIPSNSNSPI